MDPFNAPGRPTSGPSRFTLDAILDRLGGAQDEEADGYLVSCPAHDDSHASLRVALSDEGKVLMKCRAGCNFADVLKAADLRASDLFDVKPGSAVRVAREDQSPVGVQARAALALYLDRAAKALHRLSRGPDEALQYAYNRFGIDSDQADRLGLGYDDGNVEPGDLGLSRALYRDAPRLVVPFNDFEGNPHYLQARALDGHDVKAKWSGPANPDGAAWAKYGVFRAEGSAWEEIVVTEGPGDALTVVGAGYDAVLIRGAGLGTNPRLADEIAEGVRGRRVIVAGDTDTAGQKFTRDVAEALSSRGVEVGRLTLPQGVGKDLTDWRKALGGDRFNNVFSEAVRDAPTFGADALIAERLSQTITRLFSDVFNAEILHASIIETGSDVRYTPEIGFLIYEEQYGTWRSDSEEWIRRHAHSVAERVQNTVLRQMQDMDAQVAKIEDEKLREQTGKFLDAHRRKARQGTLVTYTLSTPGIDRMIRELRALPGVTATFEQFDKHPRLLPAKNGVINLETGDLIPYSEETKGLYLMRRVNVDYKPDAVNPRWERFIEEIFPERPDLVHYLQTLVGYGITGLTTEQCFAILWGNGSNGKSVFMDTLTGIFRGITVTTPFATFEQRSSGGIPNDLAALKGARLVMASEGEREKKMAENTIKTLTGDGMISARFLHKEFFEFEPTFLIMLATNYRPNFRGQDEGIWRRVRLIPFVRHFDGKDKDVYLGAKLLGHFVPRAAYRADEDFGDGPEGILAWAVRGSTRYLTEGLRAPKEVLSATDEYRTTSDALSGFLGKDPAGNVLVKDPKGKIPAKEAWELYRAWVQEEGLDKKEQWRRATLFDALEERGAIKRSSAGVFYFRGIRRVKPSEVHAEDEPEAPAISTFTPETEKGLPF